MIAPTGQDGSRKSVGVWGPGVRSRLCPQNGFTSLIIAASKGHLEVVKLLLDKGANVNQMGTVRACVLRLARDPFYVLCVSVHVCVCARARARADAHRCACVGW